MEQIIYLGTVTSVCDEYHGDRIRVKVPSDPLLKSNDDYPFAFPLLPKILHVMPKVGEMVLVINAAADTSKEASTRFYIGPVISQPQKMYEDSAKLLDSPANMIGSIASKLETISHFQDTYGSFPRINDIGIVGRKGEDVILKDDEIHIRCGVRNNASGDDNKSLVGHVIFNSSSPAYIQLKHRRGASSKCNNLINMVGSGINLMSNSDAQDITNYMRSMNDVSVCADVEAKKISESGTTEQREKLQQEIVNSHYQEPNYDTIIDKLHQVPYGDVLVQVLEVIRQAILTHTHRWAQEPPTSQNVPSMILLNTWGQSTDESTAASLKDILLSNTVRIS